MSYVFVADAQQQPQDSMHPGRARFLLRSRRAAVARRYPFTIVLTPMLTPPSAAVPPAAAPLPLLRVKIDPGSKTTGLALVKDTTGQVVWAAELTHRGDQVQERLAHRRVCRRSRRQRHTRYRAVRFLNRRRREGWLPPPLESRIQNVVTWVQRLRRLCPLDAISLELVRFDTQLLHHPEIHGTEYQQGTLAGYEVREYLLEKWRRSCAYCKRTDVPFQIEHMTPKSRHGSDAVWNLTLACEPCNQRKGDQTAAEFGYPDLVLEGKRPLRDAAVVNTARWALYHRLKHLRLPVETGTGGRRKWNQTMRRLPQDPLAGRGLRESQYPPGAAGHGGTVSADPRHGPPQPPDVSDQRRWFPRQGPQGHQHSGRAAHWGPSASGGPPAQRQGRDVCGPHRGAGDGLVQPHHDHRAGPGHSRAVLHRAAPR